ncbi:MAG TPA: hypothetical protein ENK14_00285 [Caldithrix sp.]|nr:hypothetical protein [Caldithrix sp.]
MTRSNAEYQKFVKMLRDNAMKGDSFYVKFKDDATVYLGIPVLRSNFSQSNENSFSFNVMKPKEKAGIRQKLISDIEYLQKR